MRYTDGEYAAEQPQELPAVIAELTRRAAKTLELTFGKKGKLSKAREKEVVPSSLVTRRRSYRALRPPPHMLCRKRGKEEQPFYFGT